MVKHIVSNLVWYKNICSSVQILYNFELVLHPVWGAKNVIKNPQHLLIKTTRNKNAIDLDKHSKEYRVETAIYQMFSFSWLHLGDNIK